MKRKIVVIFLLVMTLSLLTSCGDTKESSEVIPTENEIASNELIEETNTLEVNAEVDEIVEEATTEVVQEEIEEPTKTNEEVVAEEPAETVEESIATEKADEAFIDEAPKYTFTDMETTMYAKSEVNVRDLPDTSGNRVGGLSLNDEVKITGQCNETSWYRLELNGVVAYVSNNYLVSEKVAVAPPTETPNNGGNSNNSGNTNGAKYVKYGEINEEWFLTRGWLYDANNDLIYPTEETKAYFNQWAGKTIAEAEAEIGMGISMQGPWGESVSLGNNLKNIPIGTYYGIVNYAGHKLQMPF